MYAPNGQQRPMASFPSQSSGRPIQNNGSSIYNSSFRRNAAYQPIIANTPSNNSNIGSSSSSNINQDIVQDHTPRAPFYPTFGTSFGSSNPSNSNTNNNNVANNNHPQRHQQNAQHHVQQQQQHQQDHSSIGFGTPITSRSINNNFMNQYPIQNTGESSRMQDMSAPIASDHHGDQGYAINNNHHPQQHEHQQQQYTQFTTPSSGGGGDNTGSDAGGFQNTAALQQLNRHMAQLAGNVATSVSQNELMISLLERLVSLTENLAKPVNSQQMHPSSIVSTNGQATASQHPSTSSFHSTSPNAIQQDQNQRQNSENIHLPQSQSSRGQMIQQISSQAPPSQTVQSRETGSEAPNGAISITYSQPPSESFTRRQNDSISRSVGTSGSSEQHVSPEQMQIHTVQNQPENRNRSSNQTLQVPSLNDSFDDPLNFIGTPASTTFHQGDGPSERAFAQHQQTRQGKGAPISHTSADNQIRHSNTDSSDLSSAATPHSGPPRYDNEDSIMNMDDSINHIPSPVFSESIPAADFDDDFPSFDLSMNVIPRRESRRVSMRAQQQRQSLSQQYQAQAVQNQIRQRQEQQQKSNSERGLDQDAAQVEKELEPERFEQNRPSLNGQSTAAEEENEEDEENEENESANPRVVLRRGRKRKAVLPRESLRPSQPAAAEEEEADETHEGPDDLWLEWLEPRTPPPSKTRNIPKARYRTIKEVRLDRKAKTNRSLATIGRIPLKEYLEVGGDPEYRAVRRMARTVYNNWLEPNVRLAKQSEDRLLACFNRIEYDFPILADCEGHWKARELMLQVIDNAIDEVAFHKRREARLLGKTVKRTGQGIAQKAVQGKDW